METSYNVGIVKWNRIQTMRCVSLIVAFVMATTVAGVAYDQQEITVTGQVTDENNGPLPGATVAVEGTDQGTTTDMDGMYMIDVAEDVVLIFSFIGYETQEVAIEGRERIDIRMNAATGTLDEVVVTGYGETSRRKLTTSISRYEPEGLGKVAINTPGEALKGKISGVRVFNNSGQPGEEPQIRIRGGSSIQKSNEALIMVDGVERSMSDVHPEDIESIEVLKDAAATSIYGSRGSNGVVLVTTKRGGFNQSPQITFESNITHQSVERYYERVNGEQFINIARTAAARSPNPNWTTDPSRYISTNNDETTFVGLRFLEEGDSPPRGWKTMPDPLDPSRTLTYVDNDMRDIVFDPSLRSNFHLGASGGTETIRYSGSIGYTDDNGVAYATGWSRFSVRANTDIKVSDRITLSTNLNFIETIPEEHPNQQQALARQAWGPPTQKLYMEDGTPAPGYNATVGNPIHWVYHHLSEQEQRRTSVSADLRYDITDNLNASLAGDYFISNNEFETFERANTFNSLRPATSQISEVLKSQFTGLVNYNFSIGSSHDFDATAGAEYLEVDNSTLSASARGAVSDKVMTLNVAPEKTGASSFKSGETLISGFGRLSYDYTDKYLMTLSIRRDGSSRFGAENRYALFPSVSVGWNISEENFMQDQQLISFLKLRASYGQTGNNDIGLYEAQGSYSLSYRYGGSAGIRNTIMPNPNLTWETTDQFDIGFDLGLFNDRLLITADLYDKRTKDLLFDVPLPNTSGFSNIESNVGEVRFYGYEFEISADIIQKPNLSWKTSFNIGGNKNEVLKLPENGRDKNRIGGWVVPDGEDFGGIAEGEPLYRIWGHKVDYIIDNEEQAANALYDEYAAGWDYETQTFEQGRKLPGDYEWVDRDGDGRITDRDLFELGRTVPHTIGGLSNTVTYKAFTFRLHMDYAIGHSMLDQNYGFSMHSAVFNNLPVDRLDSWQEPGDAARGVEFPRFEFHSTWENWNFRRPSSAWHFSMDYLAIRELEVNYQLPVSLVEKWGMREMNVYVTGHNLHYFTDVLAQPPENGSSSGSYGSNDGYPPIRKITMGFRANF